MKRKKERIFKKVPSIDVQLFLQEQIKKYIIEKNFSPGDKLPSETELSKEFGVSRSTIREALRALEGIGILISQHGSGWYIKSFSFDILANNLAYSLRFDVYSIFDLLEIRKILEISFLKEALESIKDRDLKELERVITNMESKSKEGKSFVREDMMFHRILFRRVKNQILVKILDIFWGLFEHLDEPLLYSANQEGVINYHKKILENTKVKDYEKTKIILEEHFIDVYERLSRYKDNIRREV
ncbi:MAG: FadR/GntR family transcriptional regulator [Thermodesulfovibrio sp.]|nr:FadR/GntR family transcriptional regulator [Thermodesulfovibrio sp.]